MNKSFTLTGKHLLIGGLVILGLFLLLGANKYGSVSSDQGELPVTAAHIAKVGGFEHLTPRQKEYVRNLYIHDLKGLVQVCEYRLQVALARGQRSPAEDLNRCVALLQDAAARVERGGDPTVEQTLINDVNQALRR